jgi:hypothetical protein
MWPNTLGWKAVSAAAKRSAMGEPGGSQLVKLIP